MTVTYMSKVASQLFKAEIAYRNCCMQSVFYFPDIYALYREILSDTSYTVGSASEKSQARIYEKREKTLYICTIGIQSGACGNVLSPPFIHSHRPAIEQVFARKAPVIEQE